jgi:hypothetical protein
MAMSMKKLWRAVAAALALPGCALPTYGTEGGAADLSTASGDAGSGSGGDAGADVVDAGDGAAPTTNLLPGSPYLPATCRGGADCVGDSQWDVDGATPPTLVCFAAVDNMDGVPHDFVGWARCQPTTTVGSDGVVLCLSDLDCDGYACVTEHCPVTTYAPSDGGAAILTGVTPILVSYCAGLGGTPAGCD